MSTHEFTFGGVPCFVVTNGTPSVATMYLIVNGGDALRRITNTAGEPLELVATQEIDSLGSAVQYLVRRFGQPGEPMTWGRPPSWQLGRTILEDFPFREGEPLV